MVATYCCTPVVNTFAIEMSSVASSPRTIRRMQRCANSCAAVIWIIMSTSLCWFTCILASGFPKAMRCWQWRRVTSQRCRAVTGPITTGTMRSSWN